MSIHLPHKSDEEKRMNPKTWFGTKWVKDGVISLLLKSAFNFLLSDPAKVINDLSKNYLYINKRTRAKVTKKKMN